MANQRKPGQTFIGLQADENLAAALDQARKFKDRSLFIREAIAEKLKQMGIDVPEEWIYPPPAGKMIVADNRGGVQVNQVGKKNMSGDLTEVPKVSYKKTKKKK